MELNDLNAFRAKLGLSPNAMLARGVLKARGKNMASVISHLPSAFQAHDPHYLTKPVLRMEGLPEERKARMTEGLQVESSIHFSDNDFPEAYNSVKVQRPWARIQITMGEKGVGPSQSEIDGLLELSAIITRIASTEDARGRLQTHGTPIIFAAYLAMSSGSYGSVEGRLVPVGIFAEDGKTIWLNPLAVARKVIKAPWPEDQKVREITPKEGNGTPAGAFSGAQQWYPAAVAQVRAASPDLKGEPLVVAALNARVTTLTENGAEDVDARKAAYGQYKEFFANQGLDPIEYPWKDDPKDATTPAASKAKTPAKPKAKSRSGEPEMPKAPVAPAPGAKAASKKAGAKAVQMDLGFDL